MGKQGGNYIGKWKMKVWKRKKSPEKELNTNNNNKPTIETKFGKHGNIVSMFENIKEVDEERIIKEHITSLSRDNTTLLQADNFEGLYEINNLLIIKSGVTKKIKQLKNWSYLSI